MKAVREPDAHTARQFANTATITRGTENRCLPRARTMSPPSQTAATVPLRFASYMVPPARPLTPNTVSLRNPTSTKSWYSSTAVTTLAPNASGTATYRLKSRSPALHNQSNQTTPTTSVSDEYSDHVTGSDGHSDPPKLQATRSRSSPG